MDGALTALGEWLDTKVGVSAVDLVIEDPVAIDDAGRPVRIINSAETNLGDLLSDAFRVRTGADVGFVCGANARAKLASGDVTMRDLVSVYPFGNHVCMLEITGQQLLDALEWGAKDTPVPSRAFPQVSGVTYEIHTYIQSSCQVDDHDMFAGVTGEYRVKNVTVGGEPLELDRTYKITATDYLLLNHGNGFTMFEGKLLLQPEALDYAAVADYIRDDLKGVIGGEYESSYGQGRIVAVEEPTE